jgi:hypothetical protein
MTENKYKNHILLYGSNKTENVTVGMYEEWMRTANNKEEDKEKIANLIHDRLYRRYLKPFDFNDEEYKKEYKNSFSIMANNCLLIETLESFYKGWENTSSRSELAFLKFFSRDENFQEFAINDMPSIFYKNIRCGILHQGETTGGWRISRGNNETSVLNIENKFIHSVLFQNKLKTALKNYRDSLIEDSWTSPLWKKTKKKMKSVINNCK